MRKDEGSVCGRACVAGVCWAGPEEPPHPAPPRGGGEATETNHPPPPLDANGAGITRVTFGDWIVATLPVRPPPPSPSRLTWM